MSVETEIKQTGKLVDVPSWKDVDALFDQRSPEFADLRQQVISRQHQELMDRIANNPTKDREEVSAGVYREQLEPQCRDAVMQMRRKGYQTYNSGFGVGDLQVLDGVLGDIDTETLRTLRDEGFLVYESEPGNVSIAFKPENPDLDEMTTRWGQMADILPDRGVPAELDTNSREQFLSSFAQPGSYGYESAIRLEVSGQDQPAVGVDFKKPGN